MIIYKSREEIETMDRCNRVVTRILGALAVWLGAQLLLIAAGSGVDLINPVINALVSWPGPFDVFTGRWVLIDV